MESSLDKYTQALNPHTRLFRVNGRVSQVIGLVIESDGPTAAIGEICRMEHEGRAVGLAEVVGFRGEKTLLMPLGEMERIRPGLEVVATGRPLKVNVGAGLLGRIVDGLGNPLDNKGPLDADLSRPVFNTPPNPLTRRPFVLLPRNYCSGD